MRAAVFIILALGFSAGSCSSPTDPGLEGGVLATFDVDGERYSIFITNPQTIDQVIALSQGQSDAKIPNGLVVKGKVSYNLPWHWHIDSEHIYMAEMTIEINDGRPSYVEANLDSWAGRYFGPWGARLVFVKDYR
jgi:hypothetical protein